uniref:Nudix hydrolase domain-containing protein n=2 Tax=Timema TaxID=61471 RepID=A0A7R9IIB7_9NEOP|nr:unnamed protein product [Timema bartmani]CAD7458919.1 unnamed protein product [Timema tahoe]
MFHVKSRSAVYPRSDLSRLNVPDEKVPWTVPWPDYNPPNYTSKHIKGQSWADPEIGESGFSPRWNSVDGKVNRKSHHGDYELYKSTPLNIIGRTGLSGRGILGRWGPNHAADPIVTRWKRNKQNIEISIESKKPILQFVAIQRKDTGEWAIPGGMVDPGEVVTTTLKREFMEEALNTLGSNEAKKRESLINKFFSNGEEIYRGYVDDHRNTDNAWIETVAMNFHDESGNAVGLFPFCAGDDADNVQWTDISANLLLYASHTKFISLVAEKRGSHW